MPESLTDDQHRRRKAVAEVLPTTPFLKGLGIVFERYEPDDVTVRLRVRRRHQAVESRLPRPHRAPAQGTRLDQDHRHGLRRHRGGSRGADLPDRVMTNSRSPYTA
jgi:hypothetical protein